ncbi:hypothetical protein Poli38472_010882 [Pythium oligandrum]|uniref:non-specific serine/threonine protein kinase n=1 Tax=Pythium oligandrum TaxID=41045 RepID=A0A8K1CF03_PYTOL|nr:hypothetical protein Poli38472_010882 [Pythium oligandrum]|eukprot:TMW61819.1 hypothetical protein Poli38472_010882 [Pythium oligandrum]
MTQSPGRPSAMRASLLVLITIGLVSAVEAASVRVHLRAHGLHKSETVEDDMVTVLPNITCPAATEPLASLDHGLIMSNCPSQCTDGSICVFYPSNLTEHCVTTPDRTCFQGDSCAYECIPNANLLFGWYITVYNRPEAVEEVIQYNTLFPDERGITLNASIVPTLDANFTLQSNAVFFYLSGNEAANNYDRNFMNKFAIPDYNSLPRGDIVPFQIPATLYKALESIQEVSIENLPLPAIDAAHPPVFDEMVHLFLRNTQLRQFPFPASSLKNLTLLDVSVNMITSIELGTLPEQLTKLNVSTNAITNIAIGSLPRGLQVLDVADNRIGAIANGTLPSTIMYLYLETNGLTQIPSDVASMVNLTEFYMTRNPIGDVPEGSIPVDLMDTLGLESCGLRGIPRIIQDMEVLTNLFLTNNDLSTDPDFTILPPSLTVLDVANTQLREVPKSLANLTSLVYLFLGNNPSAMHDLTTIPLTVDYLDLTNNSLDDVPPGVENLAEESLLDLSLNPLGKISPGSLPSTLYTLFIKEAVFTELPAGVLPASLVELFVEDSLLESAPADLLDTQLLANLTIARCHLSSFENVSDMPWLQNVNLQGNKLTSFRSRLPILVTLDLRNNSLETFELAQAPLLTSLQLGENSLTEVPVSIFDLKALTVLNLTHNPIHNFTPSVEQYAFLQGLDVLMMDQDMFNTSCDNLVSFREFAMCPPWQNVTNIEHESPEDSAQSKRGASPWTLVLNIGLLVVFVVVSVGVYHRRRIYKRRMREMDMKSAISDELNSKRGLSIWEDDVLLQHRLDNDLVIRSRMIGSGMYGEVWLATYQGKMVALKKLRHIEDRSLIQQFMDEIKLVASLDHPRLVQFVGVVWTKETDVSMLTEFMPRGDLRGYLDEHPRPKRNEPSSADITTTLWSRWKLQVALEIVEALVYLHSLEPILIHRDLKSRNVLLDNELHAKLSDFGVSRFKIDNELMTACVGTARWIAPEVLSSREYDESADIYSLGILLSELDTHEMPFHDAVNDEGEPLSDSAIAGQVLSGTLTVGFSSSCPVAIRLLGERCTSLTPSLRPTSLQVAYELRMLLRLHNESMLNEEVKVEDSHVSV